MVVDDQFLWRDDSFPMLMLVLVLVFLDLRMEEDDG